MEPIVLEDWLRMASSSMPSASFSALAPASIQGGAAQLPANAIVHAWSQIRALIQQKRVLTSPSDSEPFELLNQHLRSLHLADSQARLLQAVLSEVSSSDVALLGFVRRFAISGLQVWIRKSFAVPARTTSAASTEYPAPEALVSIVQSVLKATEEHHLSDLYTCEAILLLGTISKCPNLSAAVRSDCLSAIVRELGGRRAAIVKGGVAHALAGAGYALAVSSEEHSVPIFQALLLLWTQNYESQSGAKVMDDRERMEGEFGDARTSRMQDSSILEDQIMLLHLMDFWGSILLSRESAQPGTGTSQMELIQGATRRLLENNGNMYFIQCTSTMACAGLLRSFYRWDDSNKKRGITFPNRHKWLEIMGNLESIVIMICDQAASPGVAMVSKFLTGPRPGSAVFIVPAGNRHLSRCVSVAVSRCRGVPAHLSILQCLLFSIFGDALSLDSLYSGLTSDSTGNLGCSQHAREIYASQDESMLPTGNGVELAHNLDEFQAYVHSFFVKEIGAIARAMCDQYLLTNGDLRAQTEHLISEYTRNLYERHRLLVAVSQTSKKQDWSRYRQILEKVLETAFMTVVIFFSLAVKEQVPNDSDTYEGQLAARALDSLSCLEYFRHVQLREFSKVVQRSVSHIAGSEAASVFLARLLPSYEDIVKNHGTSDSNLSVNWAQDEVQTARLLFYLRVMPLCLNKMPEETFAAEIAPTLFLYLQHPSETVSKASHGLFAAFLSLGGSSEPPVSIGARNSQSSSARPESKLTLREQLVLYYMQKALEGFPRVTPFQGLAVGTGAIARQLPSGSPATVYCLKALVDKTEMLYSKEKSSSNLGQNEGKPSLAGHPGVSSDELRKYSGEEVRAARKLQILLLHLVLLVDLQVLPLLLKLVAKLILGLPKDFQTKALAEAFDVVGCTNDYTRKPVIVPWLQSLSFLCKEGNSKERRLPEDTDTSAPETRSVKVSNPESIGKSNSVDVATANSVGGDTRESEETSSNVGPVDAGRKGALGSQTSRPGDSRGSVPGGLTTENDQIEQNDTGQSGTDSERTSKL